MTEPLEGDTGIVATVTTAVKTVRIAYPMTTTSEFVIQDALEVGGIKLPLEEVTLHVEEIKRYGGLGKIKFGASVVSGSAEIEIEIKPKKEIKLMAGVVYRRERST